MKYFLIILCYLIGTTVNAQSKKTINALSNTRLLEQTFFETKDSLTLEGFFAKKMSFVQPDGKTESREEAIKTIVNNRSVYTYMNSPSAYNVTDVNDSMIVKHFYNAMEKRIDGTQSILKLSIESVWAKEKGKWKLFRCQIIKL